MKECGRDAAPPPSSSPPAAAGDAWASSACFCPHLKQYAASGGSSVPQLAQCRARAAPQNMQNADCGGFSLLHWGQFTTGPFLASVYLQKAIPSTVTFWRPAESRLNGCRTVPGPYMGSSRRVSSVYHSLAMV
jgi:hypothetical protein